VWYNKSQLLPIREAGTVNCGKKPCCPRKKGSPTHLKIPKRYAVPAIVLVYEGQKEYVHVYILIEPLWKVGNTKGARR